MLTYEEMHTLLTFGLLIIAILSYVHKKQPSCFSAKEYDGYFKSQILSPGQVTTTHLLAVLLSIL